MSLDGLLTELETRGIELWLEADRLRFRAPQDTMTPDLRDAVSTRKQEIIERLRDRARSASQSSPQSYNQQSLYFLHRAAPESAAYAVGFAARVRSAIDLTALTRAFQALSDRHPVLRTTYELTPDGPVQLVHGHGEPCLEIVDASGLSEEALRARVDAAYRLPFDLEKGPLARVHLFSRTPCDHVLLLVFHHIAVDGWSLWILLDELRALYAAHATGGSVALPRPSAEYTDFVRTQREMLGSAHGAQLAAYWERQLRGDLLPLDLPLDHPRPAVSRSRGATVPFTIDQTLLGSLKILARDEGTTLFTVLLAAYQVLLSRHTGQTDILVGSPVFGRGRSEFQAVVGDFVNTVVMRADLSEDPSFRRLLVAVRQTVLDAVSHEEYPFPMLVQRLGLARETSRSPLYQAMFSLQKAQRSSDIGQLFLADGSGAPVDFGGLSLAPYALTQQEGVTDLLFEAAEIGGVLVASLKYNIDLFERSTIERMQERLKTLLQAIIAAPDRPVSELDLVPPAERSQVLVEWNQTARTFDPDGTLQQCFAAQVARTPDAPAVTCRGESWTYRELDERAERIAARLRARGAGPDVIVGICMQRSNALLAGLLGILKAGGAYLPLDAAYPPDRLAFMVQDAQPLLVITDRHTTARLAGLGITVLDVDAGDAVDPTAAPAAGACAGHNLAYVIYTSGSTGTRKGVLIEHRNVMHLFAALDELYGLEPGVSIAAASISFDASVVELFWPIVRGYHVVIWPRITDAGGVTAEQADTSLAGLIRARQGTFMLWPLSIVRAAMMEEGGVEALAGVRTLCIGGEALTTALLDQLGDVPTRRIINMYGPTEITVAATAWVVEPGADRIPIGRPLANTQLYVLDPAGHPSPIGVTGELYIGGSGVGRGYLNRPELTAERFIPNPFGDPGTRLYRSGDLVRYLPDGNLEFIGRADGQVKIRGFRVELGEIEQVLTSNESVREAVVIAHSMTEGDARLVAFVVPGGSSVDDAELRSACRARMPEYMVPCAIVSLDSLPVTSNGKVDRQKLSARAAGVLAPVEEAQRERIAPRNPIEREIAGIWRELLQIPEPGVTDDFFMLGGHSLLAIQLVARLRERYGMDVPMRVVFDTPILEALAASVAVLTGAAECLAPALTTDSITATPRDEPLPLSFSQERLWFLNQLEPESTAYSAPIAFRLEGAIDLDALHRSWETVIDRHEALRTRFSLCDGHPMQVIVPRGPAVQRRVDLSDRPGDRWAAAIELATTEARRPFDLEAGPLVRIVVYSVGAREHLMLVNLHHIVSDQWSMGILMRELSVCYAAYRAGRAPALSAVSVQYADFAAWQRRTMGHEALQEQLAYWKTRLAGLEPLTLSVERPAPEEVTVPSVQLQRTISPSLLERLRALSIREGVTPSMTFLAAFLIVLRRYSAREDIAVGAPVANRRQQTLESIVGIFINILVLRTDLSGNPSVRELLARVRKVALDAYERQDVPFERMVAALHSSRDQSRPPLVQVMFNVLTSRAEAPDLQDLTSTLVVLQRGEPQVDLSWSIDPDVTGSIYAEFDATMYRTSTIASMLAHYETALERMVADLDCPIDSVDLLSAAERSEMLGDRNETTAPYAAAAGLDGLFEEQAARTPEGIAVRQQDIQLTYAALNARANQIAHRLRKLGVGPNVLVAVGLHRTPDLVATLVAVAKAGGAYVPMDPAFPAQRLAWMLEDAQPAVLVTERALAGSWPVHGARVLCVDDPAEGLAGEETADAGIQIDPEALAYVIFTSGSTGRPKGVQIPRRAVVNFLTSMQREPGMTAADRLLAVTTLSFDIAVLELFLPLVTGASVVLATRDEVADGAQLMRLLAASGATIMQATPATWRMLVERGWRGDPKLRVLCGGEPMPPDLAGALLDRAGEVWNLYGPTETTVWSTLARVTPGAPITVGRPIANTQVYVLGPAREPLPAGVAGELWIGGDGVALGYLGRPELTAQRFVPNPFCPGALMYATGDLARWTRHGELEHLGRADDQVKIRGFRIELGEIEQVLASHASVRQVAAVAYGDAGEARLVAHIVPASGAIDVAELRQHARERLPEYMVPAAFLTLAALPTTSNGKLDRKALAGSTEAALRNFGGDKARAAASRTPIEETLLSIWADLLGVRKVGVDDDFFELGGHSLLAARLMLQLSDIFWIELPLRLLFDAPTVARMAAVLQERLEAKQAGKSSSEVLEINTAGTRPPFIFLHAALQGEGFYCFNLARHLGDDQPMYALAPLGLDGSETPATVQAIAARQLETIRRIQPHGPYYIGGFCASGSVAFELAQMLKAAGERVELTVIIEGYIHEPDKVSRLTDRLAAVLAGVVRLRPKQRARVFRALRPFLRRASRARHMTLQENLRYSVGRVRAAAGAAVAAARQWRTRSLSSPMDQVRAVAGPNAVSQAVLWRYLSAIDAYVAQPYDGPAIYLKAEASAVDTTPAWTMAAPHLRVQIVKGDHNTCITTQVDSLGGHLRDALREAQARAGRSGSSSGFRDASSASPDRRKGSDRLEIAARTMVEPA